MRVAEFHAGREELFGARTRLGEPFVEFAGEADGVVAGDVIVVGDVDWWCPVRGWRGWWAG